MSNNTKEIHLTVLSQAPFDSFGDIAQIDSEAIRYIFDNYKDTPVIGEPLSAIDKFLERQGLGSIPRR